jgi:hypothetical protein
MRRLTGSSITAATGEISIFHYRRRQRRLTQQLLLRKRSYYSFIMFQNEHGFIQRRWCLRRPSGRILDRLRLHIQGPNVRSDTSFIATATGCKTLNLAHQRYLYVNFAIFPAGSAAIGDTVELYPRKIAIVVSRKNYIHDESLQITEFDRRYCRA